MITLLIGLLVVLLDKLRYLLAATLGENAGKVVDWLSFKLSGTHKIQRICSSLKGLHKMSRLEHCLRNSKHPELKNYRSYGDVSTLSTTILNLKHIDPVKDPEFTARLNTTFSPMCEINKLTQRAVELARTRYDVGNEEHEELLLGLWRGLQPGRELEGRRSEMWGDVGFQGDDPATDFRGMGVLGLMNLHYLATHKKSGTRLLGASNHPQYGFSLAITSINLTALLLEMLQKGPLRNHFYYKCCHGGSRTLTLADLHEAHCSILSDFIGFYQARKPVTIMEFNIHKAAYAEVLREKLESAAPLLETVQ